MALSVNVILKVTGSILHTRYSMFLSILEDACLSILHCSEQLYTKHTGTPVWPTQFWVPISLSRITYVILFYRYCILTITVHQNIYFGMLQHSQETQNSVTFGQMH